MNVSSAIIRTGVDIGCRAKTMARVLHWQPGLSLAQWEEAAAAVSVEVASAVVSAAAPREVAALPAVGKPT